MNNMSSDTEKLALFMRDQQYYAVSGLSGTAALKLQKEKSSKMLTISIVRNSIFSDVLNEVMNELIPSGIPQFLYEYGMWSVYRYKEEKPPNEATILSFSDLEFGFVIWIVVCGISVIEFLLELSIPKLKKAAKAFVNNCGFLAALYRHLSFNNN
jgi:hypothetical protein